MPSRVCVSGVGPFPGFGREIPAESCFTVFPKTIVETWGTALCILGGDIDTLATAISVPVAKPERPRYVTAMQVALR